MLVVKNPPSMQDTQEMWVPSLGGRPPGGGHGNPLQYSCLENPMDRDAWQAMFHKVAQSQTWLKQLSTQHAPTHVKQLAHKGPEILSTESFKTEPTGPGTPPWKSHEANGVKFQYSGNLNRGYTGILPTIPTTFLKSKITSKLESLEYPSTGPIHGCE